MLTFDHENESEWTEPDEDYGDEHYTVQIEGDQDYWEYWLDMNDMTNEDAENYFDSLIDID